MQNVNVEQIKEAIKSILVSEFNRDPDPIDPNKDYDFTELSTFIRNKLFGSDVREAIAKGVEKAGLTSEKAIKITEQLIDGSFDEAELTTAIEQRLEKLERDYAPNLSNVKSQLARTDNKLQLNDWELQNKTRVKKPLVTFIDDDGRAEVLTKLKPLSDQYGVPFTSTVFVRAVEENFSNYMDKEDLLHLQNDFGWEVSSHTYNHPNLGNLSDDEQEYELRHSKEILKSWGLAVNTICYPYDGRNDKTYELARKYYRAGRRTGGGINRIPLETFEMRSVPLGSWFDFQYENVPPTDSLEYYKFRVDQAVENGGWVIFMTHVADPNHNDTQQQYLEETIQYIQSLGVEIVTFNEGLNRIGNIFDTGHYSRQTSNHKHFVIGADGTLDATDVQDRVKRLPTDTYSSSSAPTDFDFHFIFKNRVSFSNREGFPEDAAGNLTTDTTGGFAAGLNNIYQKYRVAGSNNEYIRTANNDDTWGEWELVNGMINIMSNGEATPNMLAADYPSHKLSVCRVNPPGTGWPSNTGGKVMTNRLATAGTGYSWQEFDVHNSWDKFKRYERSDGTWSEWREFVME